MPFWHVQTVLGLDRQAAKNAKWLYTCYEKYFKDLKPSSGTKPVVVAQNNSSKLMVIGWDTYLLFYLVEYNMKYETFHLITFKS